MAQISESWQLRHGLGNLIVNCVIGLGGLASGALCVMSGKLDTRAAADDVLRLLDYPACFELAQRPLPADKQAILDALADDRLIRRDDAGCWAIINLGAILFAKQLDDFPSLRRKSVRVVQYRGLGRTETLKENEWNKGYASSLKGVLGYDNGLVVIADPEAGTRNRSYLPFWAAPRAERGEVV